MVLKLEWNPLHPRTPPTKSTGLILFLSLLLIFFFFFGSDFSTASCSCSSSTPVTASSLASALYLIQTNYIAVLI